MTSKTCTRNDTDLSASSAIVHESEKSDVDSDSNESAITHVANKKTNKGNLPQSDIELQLRGMEILSILPTKVDGKAKKLAKELTEEFGDLWKILVQKYNALQQQCSELELKNEYLTGRLDERKDMLDRLDNYTSQQTKTFIEELALQKTQQNAIPSYSDVVNFPELPNIQPALILEPKNVNQSIEDICTDLNRLDFSTTPSVECIKSRNNKLILKCQKQTDLVIMKEKISNISNIDENVNIIEAKPRRMRIIIFGTPKIMELKDTDNEKYKKTVIDPTIKKITKEVINYDIIRVMQNRRAHNQTHIVLDIDSRIGNILIRTPHLFGFNRCSSKVYISVRRCHRCQIYGHTYHNCKANVICGHCAGSHNSQDCQNPTQTQCINCLDVYNNPANRNIRAQLPDFHHTAFSNKCPVYQRIYKETYNKLTSNRQV